MTDFRLRHVRPLFGWKDARRLGQSPYLRAIISSENLPTMKRVTGLGGIFFKAKDPEGMRAWYAQRLGVPFPNQYGAIFEWREHEDPQQEGHTVFSLMPETTRYFDPGKQSFMINYRVADLEGLLDQLRAEGVEVVGEMEVYDYGKFGWILDPEGNKIELWEPHDEEFRKMNKL